MFASLYNPAHATTVITFFHEYICQQVKNIVVYFLK